MKVAPWPARQVGVEPSAAGRYLRANVTVGARFFEMTATFSDMLGGLW